MSCCRQETDADTVNRIFQFRRTICLKRNPYSCVHIWRAGGYFTQRHRSYSSASVYITEPALPVLMWSCASAELSRKKRTSVTSHEKGPRMEARRALTHSDLFVQNQGDSSVRCDSHPLINGDDWSPVCMNKLSRRLPVRIGTKLFQDY